MARIRTIKPEFFTSEDIVSLSPMARLVYIALWCEADKEGRLAWKPKTFKLRYFPGDSVDIFLLCKELTDSGLVVLYGEGLAFIPTFSKHQHLNPRESSSVLPNPGAFPDEFDASARVTDASARVKSKNDAQGGREGKGREGNGGEDACDACADAPPPPIFSPEFREFIKTERPDLDGPKVWLSFCDHYPPEKCTTANWRKWVRREMRGPVVGVDLATAPATSDPDSKASIESLGLARGMGRWDQLVEPWATYKTRVKTASMGAMQ